MSVVRLSRSACYAFIARSRCSADSEVKKISNSLLERIFNEFKIQGFEIPPKKQIEILSTKGAKIEAHLMDEYTHRIVKVYESALTGLSLKELNKVAEQPMSSACKSEAHKKFCKYEEVEFLPIKAEIVEGLMETGGIYINTRTFMKKIYEIAIEE